LNTLSKWARLGFIFDLSKHSAAGRALDFAQSPQALVFNDFVRFYFSTRTREAHSRNYLSHVAYVDFSKDFRTILAISEHEVLPLGGLGCFDEHGIFPFSTFREGSLIRAYTCGWSRRVSVAVETSIGLAVSADGGKTFERIGQGPVLGPSLNEPFLVGDGYVLKAGETYHMWYIYGTSWSVPKNGFVPERTYKIGHVTSPDGIAWEGAGAGQILPDVLGPQESQALPTVIRLGSTYHMFFCFRESVDFRNTPGRGYRLGHAFSQDLTTWTRDDNSAPTYGPQGEWDSEMQCYPNVFEMDGEVFIAYNGNQFGRRGFGLAKLVTQKLT
jgi:hypothetical protein